MRAVVYVAVAAFLALLGAPLARAQLPPPIPACTTLSAPVVPVGAIAAGSPFVTTVTCAATPLACGCIPTAPLPYGASATKSINGTTCVCNYTVLADTPAHTLSMHGCAACPDV